MNEPRSLPPGAQQQASATVRAMARDARRAVRIQVIVAAVALAATLGFAVLIYSATQQLTKVRADLANETRRLEAASRRVAFADEATGAVLGAAAALATREPARYAAAIESLATVHDNLAQLAPDLDEVQDAPAIVQLRQARVAVAGTLARVLAARPDRRAEDLDRAIALAAGVLREPRLAREQRFANTVALATFYCEKPNAAAVQSLLDKTFVAECPQVGANGVLPEACRTLAGVAAPPVPAFDAAGADPAWRVRTVYLQIAADADRAWAAKLALALCEAGYDAPGIETVDAAKVGRDGQLVYYYEAQASEAAWLAGSLGAPWKRSPPIRRLTGFTNLDRHTVELWLPALDRSAGAPPEADTLRRFKGCLAQGRDAGSVDRLVAQLVSDNRQDRLSAGQSLANRVRGDDDAEVIATLLAQLEGQRLDHLSAAGRLNVLYLLNVEPVWAQRPEKARLAQALATLRERAATRGIAIGSQTRDCLDSLAAKLEGRPAGDRCGGL